MKLQRKRLVAKSAVTIASAALATSALSACSSTSTADDSQPSVLAAMYPLQFAAQSVVGDQGDVENLTPPGVDSHDLELTPQQIASIQDADLVVYIEGFQPAVDDAVSSIGDRALNVLDLVDTIEGGEHSHDHGDEEHSDEDHSDEKKTNAKNDDDHSDHDHSDEKKSDAKKDDDDHSDHDHSDEKKANAKNDDEEHSDKEHSDKEHSDEDHSNEEASAVDPHVWLDPMRMATIGSAIAEQLNNGSDDSGSQFVANADELTNELNALDEEWKSGTTECESRNLVVAHEAFGYLAARYDFEQMGVNGLSPETEPSPTAIARAADFVKDNDVKTIYYESVAAPEVAQTVADETGADTAVLDPIETLPAGSDADYFSLMRGNLDAVKAGQPCS